MNMDDNNYTSGFLYRTVYGVEPTPAYFIDSIFTILTSVIGGFFIACTFVANLIKYRKDDDDDDDDDEDDDDENDADDDKDEPNLENKYYDELDALEVREMTAAEMNELKFKFVDVETPDGIVWMTYNNATESFWYYTNKSVHYKYLDAIARFFTITYNCRHVCVNYKEEYEKGVTILKDKMAEENKRQEEIKNLIEQTEKKSVFAKFKRYKQADDTKQKNYVLTDKANVFKYAGTIADYEVRGKAAKSVDIPKMDYATFKQRGFTPSEPPSEPVTQL